MIVYALYSKNSKWQNMIVHKIFFKITFISCLSLLLINQVAAHVLIFTYAYNRPELIEIQYKTFKKFLKDDYELIVINDANDPELAAKISDTCHTYHLRCIKIPQEIHKRPYLNRPDEVFFVSNQQSPCVRNCNVVQYSLDMLGLHHDDIVALFDADLFLIKEFSISQYLKGYDVAGFDRALEYPPPRNKKSFLWIGLIFLNLNTMEQKTAFNVNCGYIDDIVMDSGGYTHYYLPHAQVACFDRISTEAFICQDCKKQKSYQCTHNTQILKENDFTTNVIQLIQNTPIDWGSGSKELGMHRGRNLEFFLNNTFVHYQGASKYASLSAHGIDIEQFHYDKTKAFKRFLEVLLHE